MNFLKILKETNIWKNYPACKELITDIFEGGTTIARQLDQEVEPTWACAWTLKSLSLKLFADRLIFFKLNFAKI